MSCAGSATGDLTCTNMKDIVVTVPQENKMIEDFFLYRPLLEQIVVNNQKVAAKCKK